MNGRVDCGIASCDGRETWGVIYSGEYSQVDWLGSHRTGHGERSLGEKNNISIYNKTTARHSIFSSHKTT